MSSRYPKSTHRMCAEALQLSPTSAPASTKMMVLPTNSSVCHTRCIALWSLMSGWPASASTSAAVTVHSTPETLHTCSPTKKERYAHASVTENCHVAPVWPDASVAASRSESTYSITSAPSPNTKPSAGPPSAICAKVARISRGVLAASGLPESRS